MMIPEELRFDENYTMKNGITLEMKREMIDKLEGGIGLVR